jgi:CxC2 like cysteine cluster associated with KDZ transposases
MREWLQNYRQYFLEEMVRRDGLGGFEELPLCYDCKDHSGSARCIDCFGDALLCPQCIVKAHQHLLRDRIEVSISDACMHCNLDIYPFQQWLDGYFQCTSLVELGFIVHLGHEGASCPVPLPVDDLVVVFDVNSMHSLNLEYCGCSRSCHVEHYHQLLRAGWYPATCDRPRTAFTFELLDTYHKLTLQGKLNLYDFYHGILQKSDNCGKLKLVVSTCYVHISIF